MRDLTAVEKSHRICVTWPAIVRSLVVCAPWDDGMCGEALAFPLGEICARACHEHIDLSFDQGRRLVLGYSGIDATTQFAVACAVKEINQEPNPEPNKETDPSLQGQA